MELQGHWTHLLSITEGQYFFRFEAIPMYNVRVGIQASLRPEAPRRVDPQQHQSTSV